MLLKLKGSSISLADANGVCAAGVATILGDPGGWIMPVGLGGEVDKLASEAEVFLSALKEKITGLLSSEEALRPPDNAPTGGDAARMSKGSGDAGSLFCDSPGSAVIVIVA